MKLSEVYIKPIKEIIEEMETKEIEFHTDDDGNIKSIEIKYVEKVQPPQKEKTGNRLWA